MQTLRSVKGTKDVYGLDIQLQQYIIEHAKKLAARYHCHEVSTPIFEYSEIFSRSLGETSDIVSKEMYTFVDRSGDSLTLRPEFTAGIMRMVLCSNLRQQLPLRFFCHGPIFRYERPQAGRQRQFQQLNVEFLGENDAYSDAECIKLASDIIDACRLRGHTLLHINSIGCQHSRTAYIISLKDYLEKHINHLSNLSQVRLHKNPLRILDSKEEQDLAIIAQAPIISDYYTPEAKAYFEKVLYFLGLWQIPYIINPRLVRGLDYYSHTTFEFINDAIGAQSAVAAGGRYNDLAKTLGDKLTIPAVGFGAGIERLALATSLQIPSIRPIVVCPIGLVEQQAAIVLVEKLRAANLRAILLAQNKVSKRITQAVKMLAKFIIFIGDEELTTGVYRLKNLDDGQEQHITFTELLPILMQEALQQI